MTGPDDHKVTGHPDDLARTAMERSSLYGFLASVFRKELTGEELEQLRTPAFREALSEAGMVLDDAFLDQPADALLERLAVEYTALFLGPGGHISPHESVQKAGAGGNLWGPETVAMKAYVEAAGFEFDPDYRGVPDHISVELDFMAEATRQEADAWREKDLAKAQNCLEFQQDFLSRHLGTWAGDFCAEVIEVARLPFYREIAKLTSDFLESEVAEIESRRNVTALS